MFTRKKKAEGEWEKMMNKKKEEIKIHRSQGIEERTQGMDEKKNWKSRVIFFFHVCGLFYIVRVYNKYLFVACFFFFSSWVLLH